MGLIYGDIPLCLLTWPAHTFTLYYQHKGAFICRQLEKWSLLLTSCPCCTPYNYKTCETQLNSYRASLYYSARVYKLAKNLHRNQKSPECFPSQYLARVCTMQPGGHQPPATT